MLATAGSCLFGLFGALRPPRQILVVRLNNLPCPVGDSSIGMRHLAVFDGHFPVAHREGLKHDSAAFAFCC